MVHVARVGGQAVDVGASETGVLDRREAGLEREVERVAVDASADLGLADAGDHRSPFADLAKLTAIRPTPA